MAKLPRAVIALIAAGAGSAAIATQFIGDHEGLTLQSYQDGASVWTICRGHTHGVKPGMVVSEEDCRAYFKTDLGRAFDDVARLVKVPMSEPQRAAVVSFCGFNIGATKCAKSTFLRKLNAGDKAGACREILRWVFVGGFDCTTPGNRICPGIWTRRQQEYQLCML